MRLVTFEVATATGPQRRVGALRNEDREVVDLNAACGWLLREAGEPRAAELADATLPLDMLAFLAGGEQAMDTARETLAALRGTPAGPRGERVLYARADVRLLAPVPRPWTIRDYSTFEEHMTTRNPNKPPFWYSHPTCYKGNPWTVIGPEDPIFWPHFTDRLDLEPELGFYVGKEGHDLTIEQAREHIAGYTIFIDCSARDRREIENLGPYKAKDFCNVMGPCMVTPDEFDELNARVHVKVNGETWFEGNTGHLRAFDSPSILAFASDCETVHPGDFIGLGTTGLGCSVDLQRWAQPGDHVEIGIEGIGAIGSVLVRKEPVVDWARNGIPTRLPRPEGSRPPESAVHP